MVHWKTKQKILNFLSKLEEDHKLRSYLSYNTYKYIVLDTIRKFKSMSLKLLAEKLEMSRATALRWAHYWVCRGKITMKYVNRDIVVSIL